MGNWQERIKQAFEARQAQERKEARDALRRGEEEERLIKENKLENQRKLLIARKIFANTRPDVLLEKVREDVWGGVGKVTTFEVESNGDVHARLEYRRNGEYSETRYSQGDYESNGPSVSGVYWDRFEIYAHERGFVISFYNGFDDLLSKKYSEHTVGLSSRSNTEHKAVSLDGENYPKAKEDLEQAVMSICEQRIISQAWPFKK